MTLNLGLSENAGGSFNPYIKYNAKDGTISKRVDGEDVPVKANEFSGMFDFQRIKTGQFDFSSSPPQKVYDKSLSEPSENMGGGFKRGFTVLVHSPSVMGGTYEFSSTAEIVKGEISSIYNEWKNKNTNELPIVKIKNIKEIKSKHGRLYVPEFNIEGFEAPPPELLEIEIDLPSDESEIAPMQNGSAEVSQQSDEVKPLPHTVATPQSSEGNSTKKNF